ncbi:MAG TPA: bifunctional acetate--CoA ligase family protein/GNAT family N-acetyltransferase [Bryobacteraceae bacterium]|nr:bifunctional acetate--CoA ligase family protein/GNAT family N-acetyltransferase [Bryobacteraceae bacterium]
MIEIPAKAQPRRAPLESFFRPRNIAVIGATEAPHSVGLAILSNLRKSFGGGLYPVNPKHAQVSGLACYPRIADIPEHVDLAVIVTPARTVPGVIRECAAAGVEAAIIISAGFREIGEAGAALEREILADARRGKMRLLGPNCLGLMSPHSGLNATFAGTMARSGHVAFISQSGALCTAILDWSQREMVGFSAFVSVGSMLDVGWGDLIQFLGDDPNTRSIVIYMESVGDARSFLSSAREVALTKPIIVIKPGRTQAASKAAASHTGALTGQDEVLDAAFRRCGVLRVDTIAELFYMAEALDKQPRPQGPRLTIVSNAGGPAVLATDALLGSGGQLAELSAETSDRLNALLPPHWSHQNPIDILGDASAERYAKAVEIAAKDPGTDGLLVILAPQAVTDPGAVAEHLASLARLPGKPLIASWMGGLDIAAGEAILNRASVPTYGYPDSAARVFQLMWAYSANLAALYETPESLETDDSGQARAKAAAIVNAARSARRTLLTEAESKTLLAAYGIPTVATEIATSPEESAGAAGRIGYPVVLKLHSETITHKTDVGGVRLNLSSEAAVREAYEGIAQSVRQAAGDGHFLGVTVQPMVRAEGYELILGSSIDSQFGPVLLFGGGGQLVEVYKDRAIGLPPLNTTLARRLMERTTIFKALGGVRGRKAVDLAALEQLIVRFSDLVVEQSWIKEIDINPLLASETGLLALDARIVLHPPDLADPPKPAIRPYPVQYSRPWKLADDGEILIRPIRPEDEPMMVRFHAHLSDRSVYLRYFHLIDLDQRTSHDRLTRICFNDYDREIALVAEHRDPDSGGREILAVGRLARVHLENEAELAVLITDEYQGKGLGTEIARRLTEIARAEKLARVHAYLLGENVMMQGVCRELGFEIGSEPDGLIHAVLHL